MAIIAGSWLISTILLCYCFIIALLFQSSDAASYNVVSYGAKSSVKTDSTAAFLRAWSAACSATSPPIFYVPRGNFLVRALEFSGPCKSRMTVLIRGALVAPSNYWLLGNTGKWILFAKVNRLSVYGGIFNALGQRYWACKTSGSNCPPATRSLVFERSSNVVVKGVTSINSRYFHIGVNYCANVIVSDIKIIAPDQSPNTDGIHIQSSNRVTVTNANIKTGDDCISIGPGATNIMISRIACGPGHGISIGSLAGSTNEAGVENVTVTTSVFTGTDNGIRIKTWARPSTGFAKGITFRNLVMNNVYNPIVIDQQYCPDNIGCPNQSSGIKISQVTFKNIKGTSATQVAMSFNCSPSNPCRGIKLQDIRLTYTKGQSTSYCKNIAGSSSGVVIPKSCF